MKLTTIKVYKAKDGWRWRMRSPNGRIVAEGGKAYVRRSGCYKAAFNLVDTISGGGVKLISEAAPNVGIERHARTEDR